MDNGYPYWIAQAYKYSSEHPSVNIVHPIKAGLNGEYAFVADFEVILPGKFDIAGETLNGVCKSEPVEFVFNEKFPLQAPGIYLRDDFCRNFPHINPSVKKVCPCVYEGDLTDLLQQPKWFDHILDQVADWLEKAAANSLIDLKQGWEPMRTDNLHGFIWYESDMVIDLFARKSTVTINIFYSLIGKKFFLAGRLNSLHLDEKGVTEAFFFCMDENNYSDKYVSACISSLSDLHSFAVTNGINNLKKTIDSHIAELLNTGKSHFFVVLGIRRPANIIGTDSEIELLNFAVDVKCQKKNKKSHMLSKVFYVSHEEICTANLLRKFSGTTPNSNKKIIQIGCGSLGSKICLHLARNGNNDFILIDKKIFSPHNNARHACIDIGYFNNKAELLKKHLQTMNIRTNAIHSDISSNTDLLTEKGLFIDSTASLAVRNYLTSNVVSGIVIQTSLYNHGRLALLTMEGKDRNPRIDDHICLIYSECLHNVNLRRELLEDQAVRLSTGQGCGSYTTKAPDSRISLAAAGMAGRIQEIVSSDVPECGEIFLGTIDERDMGITWSQIQSGKTTIITQPGDKDWEIRILGSTTKKMKSLAEQYAPKEMGGVLVGHISLINKCMTVTDLLPAPEDSKMTTTYLELGTKGLRKKIETIQSKTNGLLTYLGTWHSHPFGGDASPTDKKTKIRLLVLRDYEPTVCLIWTPDRIIRV